ncbi:MAG: hypothetical protein AAGD07_12110 [Planctomycetota bacterium]
MSSPETDLDQWLSDHLDGLLDEADQRTLELYLNEHPDAAKRCRQFESDQRVLRAIAMADTKQQDPGYASSLVELAIQRSVQQGLSDDHPLCRAADTVVPAASVRHRDTAVWRRAAVAVLASAAAVALIVTLWDRDSGRVVAELQPDDDVTPPSGTGTDGSAIVELAVVESVPPNETTDTPSAAPPAITELLADSPVETFDVSETPRQSAMDSPARGPMLQDAVASATKLDAPTVNTTMGEPPTQQVVSSSNAIQPVGLLLVYDIELTSLGQAGESVWRHLKALDLAPSFEHQLDAAVVSQVNAPEQPPIAEHQLLYIRSSAVRIDQLFSTLSRDRDSVSRIGMTMVSDPSLLKVVHHVHENSRDQLQESSVSVDLRSPSGESPDSVIASIRSREFLPLTAGSVKNMMPLTNAAAPALELGAGNDATSSTSASSPGADFIVPVLLVIR